MSLKNAIKIYQILDNLYFAGVFLIIIAIILVIIKGDYNFFLFGIGVLTLLFKYFRKDIFYQTLQKAKYKAAFISVVDKIGMDNIYETLRSDFTFYENMPIDYSAEEFLQDNNLKTVIDKKWDNTPFIIFSGSTLTIGDKSLSWTEIINWSYHHGDSCTIPTPSRIKIEHKKNLSDKTVKEYIEPDRVNASHIDILMLMYHFKKVYG